MINLYKSLAAFQQEVEIIHKSTEGFGYKYASLETIIKTINPVLKKYSLGFTQLLETEDDVNFMKTIIFSTENEETISSKMAIPSNVKLAKMNEFQVLGSAITYYRRYMLTSMLGIITDADAEAAGSQLESNGIKDSRIDEYASGNVLIDQLKKAIVSMSINVDSVPARVTIEDLEHESLDSLKMTFGDYKTRELKHNALKWFEQQKSLNQWNSVNGLKKIKEKMNQNQFAFPEIVAEMKERYEEINV